MRAHLSKQDRGRLAEKLRAILERATGVRDQIGSETLDASGAGRDSQGDEGVEQEFEDVDLDALALVDATAADALAALRRITDGSYGLCQECEAPISLARLEALPQTSYCLPCQAAAEDDE